MIAQLGPLAPGRWQVYSLVMDTIASSLTIAESLELLPVLPMGKMAMPMPAGRGGRV